MGKAKDKNRIRNKENQQESPTKPVQSELCGPGRQIVLSGLSPQQGRAELAQLFSAVGDVVGVVVEGDCATVTFSSEEAVRRLELQGELLLDGARFGRVGGLPWQQQPAWLPLPPSPVLPAATQSVFTFDGPHAARAASTSACCYVCSGPGAGASQPAGPLTPMTPSYPGGAGLLLPATPSPPSYPGPPTPAPTYFLPHSSFVYQKPVRPDLRRSGARPGPEAAQDSALQFQYFTSPFKRFNKFQGVPAQARFPLRASQPSAGKGGRAGREDISNWYQEGERWGQRKVKYDGDSRVNNIIIGTTGQGEKDDARLENE